MPPSERGLDVAVVGLGLAGLVAANVAARAGARTVVIGRGFGTTHIRSGCIDVLGYAGPHAVRSPRAELGDFLTARPGHPYGVAQGELGAALDLVAEIAVAGGADLRGQLDGNLLVATTAGTMRPTCLAPRSMIADWHGKRVLAAGIGGHRDFEPALFAVALPASAAALGIEVTVSGTVVDLALSGRRHLGGMELARLFDEGATRSRLVAALRPYMAGIDLVALPAVIGLTDAARATGEISDALGVPVVELATLPPSIPGIRLQRALSDSLRRHGGRSMVGPEVRATVRDGRIDHIDIQSSARVMRRPVERVILATGGLASGGLRLDPSGTVVETCAGVAVRTPDGDVSSWFDGPFLGESAQRAARIGVAVDSAMRPLSVAGAPEATNLFACGDLLAGADRPQEKSAEGIACASALRAAEQATR